LKRQNKAEKWKILHLTDNSLEHKNVHEMSGKLKLCSCAKMYFHFAIRG
jgi:hypothetical protein